jgi:hypothetical protein
MIIDSHIDFYHECLEHAERKLAGCFSWEEPAYKQEIFDIKNILFHLTKARSNMFLIDSMLEQAG